MLTAGGSGTQASEVELAASGLQAKGHEGGSSAVEESFLEAIFYDFK